jgi:hypothetical protein
MERIKVLGTESILQASADMELVGTRLIHQFGVPGTR